MAKLNILYATEKLFTKIFKEMIIVGKNIE